MFLQAVCVENERKSAKLINVGIYMKRQTSEAELT